MLVHPALRVIASLPVAFSQCTVQVSIDCGRDERALSDVPDPLSSSAAASYLQNAAVHTRLFFSDPTAPFVPPGGHILGHRHLSYLGGNVSS